MENKLIKHVSEYVSHIESISSCQVNNPYFLFRGEGCTEYKLIPSLFRKRKDGNGFVYLHPNTERKILLEFMTEAAGIVDSLSTDDFSRWIEYAQHFGAPTRLLDWTSNPLVALFFACADLNNHNGRVYILHSQAYRELIDRDDKNQMQGKLIKDVTQDMVLNQEGGFLYPISYCPYHMDKRMVAQASRFMVWGNTIKPLDEIIAELEKEGKVQVITQQKLMNGVTSKGREDAEILTSICVAGEYKKRILHELDVLGINQASLFPGLEGLGRSIRWRNDNRNREYPIFD